MNHVTRAGTFALGLLAGVTVTAIVADWLGCACGQGATVSDPLLWLGYWLFVAGIIIALLYLEINDKGDRQ